MAYEFIIPQTEDQMHIHNSQDLDMLSELEKFDLCVKETLSPDGSPNLDRASLLYNERFKPSNEGPGYSPDSETVDYCKMMFSRLRDGEVLEVRAVKPGVKFQVVQNADEAVSTLSRLNNGQFEKVCLTANPAMNVTGSVTDRDVTRRLWLGFDIDHPGKKAGQAPYLTELFNYESVCLAVFRDLGWAHAFTVFSGNGVRVFFACDLPVVTEANRLVEALYTSLKGVIDSAAGGEVFDSSVTNLSRIWAVPGTDNGSCGRTVTHEQTDPSTWTILTEGDIRTALKRLNKQAEGQMPLSPSEAAPPSQAPRKSNTGNGEFLRPSDPETPENIERVRSALASLDPDMSYGGWMNILRALKSTDWVCAKELAREWSAKGSKWDEGAFEDKWENQIDRQGGVSLGTLFHMAKENGWEDKFVAKSGCAVAGANGLQFSEVLRDGRPKLTHANVAIALEHRYGHRIRQNTFAYQVELDGLPIVDTVITDINTDLSMTFGLNPSDDRVHKIVNALAVKRSYHPVREYLRGLKWDGKDRISEFFESYFVAVSPSEYSRRVGEMFLLGAVARVLTERAKVDTMLILEGGQGVGKSSGLEALFSSEWFTEINDTPESKDFFLALQGKWCIEFAELTEMKGVRDSRKFKKVTTQKQDRFRPVFHRLSIDFPRQCIFTGTTNEAQYLNDATGARRFLPVEVKKVELQAIEADRDQIWAQAVSLFDGGKVNWWTLPEKHGDIVDAKFEEDPWSEAVQAYLKDHPGPVTLSQLLSHAFIGVDIAKREKKDENRMRDILQRLKYTARQERINGVKARWWYPPEAV